MASERKIAAATPGLSGQPATVTFASLRSCATPLMIACSTSELLPLANSAAVTSVPGLPLNDERTCTGTL